MSACLEFFKCILCCVDEDIGISDNQTSDSDVFSTTWNYSTLPSSSVEESYPITRYQNYPQLYSSSSLIDSTRNELNRPSRPSPVPTEHRVVKSRDSKNSSSYNIHSSRTSTKPPQLSAKFILRPLSPPPSLKTSSSPKCQTPSKPSIPSQHASSKTSPSLKPTLSSVPYSLTTQQGKGKYKWVKTKDSKPSIPSPELSSSSSKPSTSLKPTLSSVPSSLTTQQGKGTYKWVESKDKLPVYVIPEDIEDLIKRDIVPEVLRKPLSPSTYKDYFAALLYAEDYYIEKWSNFELTNVSLELHPASICHQSGKNKHSKATNKMDDRTFVVFKVDPVSKKRPFLLSRDFVFAQRLGRKVEPFQGVIYRVQKSTTILVEFGEEFHSQHDSTCRYDIRFSFNRVCLKRAHQAIAAASASLIGKFLFPNSVSQRDVRISTFNLHNHNLDLDEKSAVNRILNVQGPPPFLVKGPLCATYNCSSESFLKQLSRTGLVVKEAVLQIYRRHPESKILICAPINSTCDVLIRSLKMEIPTSDMFRANAAFREIEGVPTDILPSCLYERETECFSCPSLHELREFRVIFSTFTSSYRLYNAGISTGHFSHIFLADASSATEPETMVASANFADDRTTLIVTGSHGNRSSTVRADTARQNGLRISYFERLCELGPYKTSDSMFIAQLKDRASGSKREM